MDGNASCFILNLKVAIQLKFPKIVLIETMGWAFFSFFHVLSLTGSLLKKVVSQRVQCGNEHRLFSWTWSARH